MCEDRGRTTIEPFPGADFDCAPSICARAFIRHRDSTLLVTHLVKQANEGFLGDTAFELPRLSHPHQDGLNLPCSVRANKSDARDYTIARRR